MTYTTSTMIGFAAAAVAIKPGEHWQPMVCPGTEYGNSAASAECRPTFIMRLPALASLRR